MQTHKIPISNRKLPGFVFKHLNLTIRARASLLLLLAFLYSSFILVFITSN